MGLLDRRIVAFINNRCITAVVYYLLNGFYSKFIARTDPRVTITNVLHGRELMVLR